MTHIIECKSIGEAWRRALRLILDSDLRLQDGEQVMKELLHLTLMIEEPDENDPLAQTPEERTERDWMKVNFHEVKRIPELSDAWSYGWRLNEYQGVDQIGWVIDTLHRNPDSKRATITMLQAAGLEQYVPCVSTLDFKLRQHTLVLTAFCRSLDFGRKALHNLCNLAALANEAANALDVPKTRLVVHVVSAHVYENQWQKAESMSA